MVRAYTNYHPSGGLTSQTQPIIGREPEMVLNNAGGYGFKLDDWERLHRFLITGSSEGTYYVDEQKLTAQNAGAAIRCIKADGLRAVEMARDINVRNRAPKVDQQLFVLALALQHGDEATRSAAVAAMPQMVRIGTHLLHFVAMLSSLGGWNRRKRDMIASWFTQRDADAVAFQMLKYQNRDGWAMRDVLRLSHPKAPSPEHDAAFAWATGGLTEEKQGHLPMILANHQIMLASDQVPVIKAVWGINQGLPREALPTEAVNLPAVQQAMLPHMPVHAMLRNLGNLTASGLLLQPYQAEIVANWLVNRDVLVKSRAHPFAILLASLVYRKGGGVLGNKKWVPVRSVIEALDDAYELAFANVAPTNKRILVAVDTSGSMSHAVGGGLSAVHAASAVAITLARLEPHATVIEVDTQLRRVVPITKRSGISTIHHHGGGGTDMSIPMQWALGQPGEFDAFVILTDTQTWAGHGHPAQWLERYRREKNPKAKLICCAMEASHGNIIDPLDPLQFGVAGLDANLPSLVSDFIGR